MTKSKVIKLGGSSQTFLGYHNLKNNIINDDSKYVIVVSAIKGVTNSLLSLIESTEDKSIFPSLLENNIIKRNKELISELGLDFSVINEEVNHLCNLSNNLSDLQNKIDIVSKGETFTAKILNKFLSCYDIKTIYCDSIDFINTDSLNTSIHQKGKFTVDEKVINNLFKSYDVVVVPGFRGRSKDNKVSLMGRGGSDTTGSIIASKLKSSVYQIWTDVNGIYSGDPNEIENTTINKTISYDAAQEASAMGAKVLHPYCIRPCKEYNIPIEIKNTFDINSVDYTTINNVEQNFNDNIYTVTNQKNNCIFKIESLDMWNDYGFVYDIFLKFKKYNIDVNIINTSQFDITTTTNETNNRKLNLIREELEKNYNVTLTLNCNVVSIVGDNIKKFKKLNLIMESIKNFDIKLTSYSSNDKTLSFVVDNNISSDLSKKLHNVIFPYHKFSIPENIWWHKLLDKEGPDECRYLYNLEIINKRITQLKDLNSIDKIFYAMKANNNKDVLLSIIDNNLGFETVSIDEVRFLSCLKSNIDLLFTPNFAKIEDYQEVFNIENMNIITIVDNINLIKENPDVFYGKNIGLRLDLNYGFGHCNKVITQGQDSKFGIMADDILDNINFLSENNIKIIGLHSHMGSGISNYEHWIKNLDLLINIYKKIPSSINKIEWLDIGGGFGIDSDINFKELDLQIQNRKNNLPNIKIYIEPGRFIVAESGIIWGKVSQSKFKNNTKFIGTNIGMTDLIRPALYSAIHPVYFKDQEGENELATIVGPICESGDVLIKNLEVSKNIKVNDSIVVTNTGAYGIVMASKYNNRDLPSENLVN